MNKKKIAIGAVTLLFLISIIGCWIYETNKDKKNRQESSVRIEEQTTENDNKEDIKETDDFDWEAEKERLAKEVQAELAAKEAYKTVDADGNVLYYAGMVPNDYDISWDEMLSYLNESGREIFDEESLATMPDNIKAYLGYAAMRFDETNYIEDIYSVDLEKSVVKNINNDIITYKLQGQLSELEVTVDYYNERVHLEKSTIY